MRIPKINAGISFWGEGKIGRDTTDVWLSDFIYTRRDDYNDIHDFGILLQDELRKLVGELEESEDSPEYRWGKRGFHLAGFIQHEGKSVPTFYHIHNGLSETTPRINPRIINANHDLPPERVLRHFSKNESPNVTNGELHLYRILFENLQDAFKMFNCFLKNYYPPLA